MRGFDVPPWLGGYVSGSRSGGSAYSQMRVSDADRNEIAEALSKHFADGRLDQSEFDERMARAMAAKTQADFAGLLDDLPPIADPPPSGGPVPVARVPRHRPPVLLVAAGIVAFFIATSSWMWSWWQPRGGTILLLVILAAVVLRHRHRHYHPRSYPYTRTVWQQPPPPPPGPSGPMWP